MNTDSVTSVVRGTNGCTTEIVYKVTRYFDGQHGVPEMTLYLSLQGQSILEGETPPEGTVFAEIFE
jgi:hypothetical protein